MGETGEMPRSIWDNGKPAMTEDKLQTCSLSIGETAARTIYPASSPLYTK